jgi:hypothetical protein
MTTLLTARTPEDLLAAVPVVLGFRPSESVVMLTFGGRHCFGARVDLPQTRAPAGAVDELAETLLAPALEHGVDRVAFVVYTADAPLAARIRAGLVGSFPPAGIAVIDVLRADAGGWTSVPCRPDGREEPARPYDDRTHPFAAQAVFDGRVTHGSRDDLRAGLAADPDLRARTRKAQRALPPPEPAEHAAVLRLLRRCVSGGRLPDDEEAARVLRAVTAVEVRDEALFAVTADEVVAHLDVWSSLLRRASDAEVPDTAAVTAFCAWQAGHGALAWCALDRCLEVEPGHTLGLALAECLVRAVPPSAWQGVDDRPDAESDTA